MIFKHQPVSHRPLVGGRWAAGLLLIITTTAGAILQYPVAAAQTRSKSTNTYKKPRPARTSPKATKGQANRGQSCQLIGTGELVTFTPLVPDDHWGATLAASPTLWFHIEYSPSYAGPPLVAMLDLENRKSLTKLLPKTFPVPLPQQTGVFGLPIPHSLQQNQWYRWYLSVPGCQANSESSQDMELEGYLQRQAPSRVGQYLGQQKSLERSEHHANNGIWHDALTEAARDHCLRAPAQTPNANHAFSRLLKDDDVQLNDIVNQPVFCPG